MDDFLERLPRLIRRHRSDLVALARSEGMAAADAVDCLQDALCTLLDVATRDALPAAEEECSRLLAAMVRNAARNRRRRHYRSKPHDSVDDHPLTSDAGLAADELIARGEESLRLRECVAELCEIQRAVVTLRMLDEQPGDDVAKELGITPGHVAVLLHRAKHSLRACLTRPETRPETNRRVNGS